MKKLLIILLVATISCEKQIEEISVQPEAKHIQFRVLPVEEDGSVLSPSDIKIIRN